IGWTLAGMDQLVSISGGVIWVYGSGGFRVFTGTSGTLTNPANDFGTLVKNGDGSYTYTGKDQWQEKFNSSGYETSLVDPHGLTTTYTYSSSPTRLANVNTPDGVLVTLAYGQDMQGNQRINNIYESGSRTVSTIRSSFNGNLTGITDPDNNSENYSYDSSNRLINENIVGNTLNATYTYDSTSGLLASEDQGLGSTLNLAPAASQGLA